MTQVFSYGGVEIMHLEKGSFKVNAKLLNFGGDFHANKLAVNLSTPEIVS